MHASLLEFSGPAISLSIFAAANSDFSRNFTIYSLHIVSNASAYAAAAGTRDRWNVGVTHCLTRRTYSRRCIENCYCLTMRSIYYLQLTCGESLRRKFTYGFTIDVYIIKETARASEDKATEFQNDLL